MRTFSKRKFNKLKKSQICESKLRKKVSLCKETVAEIRRNFLYTLSDLSNLIINISRKFAQAILKRKGSMQGMRKSIIIGIIF